MERFTRNRNIMLYILVLIISFGCYKNTPNDEKSNVDSVKLEQDEMTAQDTIKRPSNLSEIASLAEEIEYGYPSIYYWIDYGGTLTGKVLKNFFVDGRASNIPDQKVFKDIHILHFYDVNGNLERSALFEIFGAEKEFEVDKESFKIEPLLFSYLIKNEDRRYNIVQVFNTDKPFISKKRLGVKFVKAPSIREMYADWIDENIQASGPTFNISIREEDADDYTVLILDRASREKTIKYKLHNPDNKEVTLDLIRYYDPETDRIYLLEKGTYLYPTE